MRKTRDRPGGIDLGAHGPGDDGPAGADPTLAPAPAPPPEGETIHSPDAGADPIAAVELERVVELLAGIYACLLPTVPAQRFAPTVEAPSERIESGRSAVPEAPGDPVQLVGNDRSRRRLLLQVPTGSEPVVVASTRELAQDGRGFTISADVLPTELYTSGEVWVSAEADSIVEFLSEHGVPLDYDTDATSA